MRYLIGTDFEFGIKDVNGTPISIVGKLGGTKDEPLSIGNGCARQEDNVFAECTIPPTKDLEEFVAFCNKNNLKYASVLQNLIKAFNKNPQKYLILN